MASKHQNRRIRRPKFSTLIAVVALFAALGGSAYAGGKLINGKNIKAGSVKSKQLKDGTIKTKDINAKAVASLKGQQGPKGDKGEPGSDGADGVIAPVTFANATGENLVDGGTEEIGSVNVTSGAKYLVTAKLNLFAGPGVSSISCSMDRGVQPTLDSIIWNPPADNKRAPVSMQALTTGAGSTISISCTGIDGTSSVFNRQIAAIPVA